MRFPGILVVVPVWLLVVAADSTPSPTASPEASATTQASPSPSPSPAPPTPTPVNAFLSLDVTAGGPATVINVTGGQFLPNEQMTLYWDSPSHVAGSATSDANGSFNSRVKPFAGDKPGQHRLCASVPPNPCADFALAGPSPSPSPEESASPSPLESPSPEASATPGLVATPARVDGSLSGFDVITHPPFVFLPLFGFGAIALALLYWAVTVIRRPRRPASLGSAAVVHRATRPDYSASFGAPPAAPTPQVPPSAWSEPMRPPPVAGPASPNPPTPSPSAQPPAPAWPSGPQAPWGPGTPDAGYPELAPPAEGSAPPDGQDVPQPGD
jgi:hypothetical protein